MAKTQIKRKGFGQVEANHLSGIVTGQIYAQLPAKSTINILEQGMFAKYDYENNVVTTEDVDGEYMLVYNEEKLYDERFQNHKDYAMIKTDFTDSVMTPRLVRTYIGDIYTTNTFGANTSNVADVIGMPLAVGDKLTVGTDGYLKAAATGEQASTNNLIWKVIKVYTMPDGQPGVKIQRVA